jgi:hypothetical protein
MRLNGISAFGAAAIAAFVGAAETQIPEPNFDESKVPAYVLPDPLVAVDGSRVENAETWRRRPEILDLFESQVYGRAPGPPADMTFQVRSVDTNALDGRATRKQVRVRFSGNEEGPRMDMLIYLPGDTEGPVPVFLGLNFFGNHTILAFHYGCIMSATFRSVKPCEHM